MIPKRVSLENFLSFGSPAAEIRFTDDEPLWVLGGPNGVGKSAVFDAITYALYAKHRGSGSRDAKVDELIRHGTTGFKIVFEFEFNRTEYRITRTRSGKTTQKVERLNAASGAWEPVPSVNSASDVTNWSEQTLGLDYDSFTASVLLRQGHSDEIITANGTRRLEILKKIIGVERYEHLSNRVTIATKAFKDRRKALIDQRDRLVPVSDEELVAAEIALAAAEDERTSAATTFRQTTERVTTARHWNDLNADHRRIANSIAAADARSADAYRIRAGKGRFDDLAASLPILREIAKRNDSLAQTEAAKAIDRDSASSLGNRLDGLRVAAEQAAAKAAEHRTAADEQKHLARSLNEEIVRESKFLDAAVTLAKLDENLRKFPPDLIEQNRSAHLELQTAGDAAAAAKENRAAIASLHAQAKALRTQFDKVEAGVPCSACGQLVTAEHAERERRRVAEELAKYDAELLATDRIIQATADSLTAAKAVCTRLAKAVADRQTVETQRNAQKEVLAQIGIASDALELRAAIEEKLTRAEASVAAAKTQQLAFEASTGEAQRLGQDCKNAETRSKTLEATIRKRELAISNDLTARESSVTRLSPAWQTQLETVDLGNLDHEMKDLERSRITDEYAALEKEAMLLGEWRSQCDSTAEKLDRIPPEARVSVTEAEAAVRTSEGLSKAADRRRDEASANATELTRRKQDLDRLTSEIRSAEQAFDCHTKLDDLLGPAGLQRELVRNAEREIVRRANDTVQNLSDGDLAIELDDAEDGPDKAFTLRVRRADDPTPIGVNYLSGSQKFRVAISVALAIGRFAAGQARPLESVIIDEGFGSLDKDGLRATADELNRLRQHLRRIVLVSHQDEFAERFPVVIRLSRGENGTVAEAVRR